MPRPSAASAVAFELVTVRVPLVVPVCRVMTPVAAAEPVPPLRPSILASKPPTVLETLIWFAPVAPDATKVSVWPSTVRVSPLAKPAVSESVLDAVASSVALVIAAGTVRLLLTEVPAKVASV